MSLPRQPRHNISAGQAYEIIGLAVDCRRHLQAHCPREFERLVHGGLNGMSHDEAADIIDQLYALRKNLGLTRGGLPQ